MIYKNIREAFMKKTICVLLIITALLCSCGRPAGPESLLSALDGPFEADAAVSDGEDVYRLHVVRNASGGTVFTFTEPAQLSGISYSFDGDGAKIVYKDLSVPYGDGADRLSRGAAVWNGLISGGEGFTAKKADGGVVCSNGERRILFRDGVPVLISSGDITISFTEYRKTNDKPSEGTGADLAPGA